MAFRILPPCPANRGLEALIPPSLAFELAYALGCVGTGLLYHLAGGTLDRALILGLACFIARHLYLLVRLSRLIARGGRLTSPFPRGAWGDTFRALDRYQQDARRWRKRQARFALRFREAANSVPDGLIMLDKAQRIDWANGGAEVLLNLSWPRDAGRHIGEFLSHPDLAPLIEGADYGHSLELTPPHNQAIKLSLRISPFGERKSQRLVVVRDITAIYHLNMIRRDFVANASHELRTPLTVIAGFLETLGDSPLTPVVHRRPIELMVSQTRRMRSIVEDLLTLSRLEMGLQSEHTEPADVPAEILAIVHEAEALSAGQHAIDLDLDPNLLLVGNPVELRSAFSNLVFNAIQHTPDGSRVHISWREKAGQPVFAVEDDGEGIAQEHIPRLTERFYRVDKGRSRASGGTGLGLAIVIHVLNRHDAQLIIASDPGKGSTFACRFPGRGAIVRHKPQILTS